jgi:pyruvate formate lyase activating enzyme
VREDYLNVKGTVFNIQTYSIHDGPGIRVTVFLKGCPLRCIWCANPESNEVYPQLMTYSNICTGCGSCIPACPAKAIELRVDEGKAIAVTDRGKCVNCGACVSVCPNEARELAGSEKTVQEVMKKVLKDKLFMVGSGGGMTISGGEPLMHPEFSACLLYAAKKEGLHTAIESCSFASRQAVDQVYPYVDLGLLDIKHMDSAVHKKLTGVSNEQILDNIKYIHNKLHIPVIIRVPTIPGCNDSDENIAATARFTAEELGADTAINLLPYHRLGESKNESLGKKMDLTVEIPSDEHMQHLQSIVTGFGIKCQIGG